MPTRKYPAWLPPVTFVAVLGVAMFLSNQTAPMPQSGELPIASDEEYQSLKQKMQDVSLPILQASEEGKALKPDDFEKIRQASVLVDRLNAYEPLFSGLYFLSGKFHQLLHEDGVAEERFRQCTLNAPRDAKDHPGSAVEINQTAAEAAYQLSGLLVARRDFKGALEEADSAVKTVPQSANYLTARASALNELRRTDEAKKDLQTALLLDPKNRRAAGLLRLIGK